ncbi:hypothetical protein N7461_000945 [Penicillium sp. DV-2018c]|nr:hypothetical protein N7461_000945 [Penicillium sp. DV-2018c]
MPPTRGKRGPELDPITRAQICELHNTNGWGATTIHKKRFPEIPRSTIQYTLMQESKRQKQESLPRSGKPKKPEAAEGDRDRDRICETKSIQQNPSVQASKMKTSQKSPASEAPTGGSSGANGSDASKAG